MKSSNTLNKYLIFLLPIIAIVAMLVITALSSLPEKSAEKAVTASPTSDGKQTISITAKGGYFPNQITAKANTETLLTVSTKNTYDCSLALVIPQLNFTKNLKPQDSVQVTIPPQAKGSEISGTCSMGMYHFKIMFI